MKLLRQTDESWICRAVMAAPSPLLIANRGAPLPCLSKRGPDPIVIEQTDHGRHRLMREFCADPATFIDSVLAD